MTNEKEKQKWMGEWKKIEAGIDDEVKGIEEGTDNDVKGKERTMKGR